MTARALLLPILLFCDTFLNMINCSISHYFTLLFHFQNSFLPVLGFFCFWWVAVWGGFFGVWWCWFCLFFFKNYQVKSKKLPPGEEQGETIKPSSSQLFWDREAAGYKIFLSWPCTYLYPEGTWGSAVPGTHTHHSSKNISTSTLKGCYNSWDKLHKPQQN